MGRIPMDIVELCILPKLPLKSLLRFKCVSKSWRTLICSNDFNQFRNSQRDPSDENRVVIFPGDGYTLHLHHLDPSLIPLPLCPCPYPWPLEPATPRDIFEMSMTILASCECFLLLSRFYYQSSGLILLNPFTRIYREIPDVDIGSQDRTKKHCPKYGLYLDESHDDLRVIRIDGFCKDDHHVGGWEITIFSSKTNLWTLIETKLMMYPLYNVDHHPPSVIKNLFYAIFCHSNDYKNMRIRCFDIEAEQWTNDVPLPRDSVYISDLCVFDGLLCALGDDKEATPDAYSAWVMKNYSWVKLMSIVPKNPNRVGDRDYRPIAYRKGSRHEILCRRKYCTSRTELFWYNLRDKEITKADFKGFPEDGSGYNPFHLDRLCKESLRSLPGGQPQR